MAKNKKPSEETPADDSAKVAVLAVAPEFSHVIEVASLPSKGRMFKVEASPDELKALAKRMDLVKFKMLKASVRVIPLGRSSVVRVEGSFEAKLSQACVVTLKPVKTKIKEDFIIDFAPEKGDYEGEREFTLSDGDPDEPLIDGKLDVAEIVTQQLSLTLDLYPRSEEADLSEMQKEAETVGRKFEVNAAKNNPFSVLAQLKDQKK